MRKKRKKAIAVLVDGVVHAIKYVRPPTVESAYDASWGAWGEYPIADQQPRRRSRAQRKADTARRLKGQVDLPVQIACSHRVSWLRAPRTHAAVNCMSCLVATSRT